MQIYDHSGWIGAEHDNRMVVCLGLGTYWKPIAFLIRFFLKRRGYSVKLRGRGVRATKHHNFDADIRIRDSVFLAIYARKPISQYDVKL